ncbi:ankyrin repeat protein [Ectocarpus siliculosus]|uniref:Ankyrin repeat protein n=1 Tax=Ectocarpus siliculosus TaxID=2880 RepID=D8LRZ8_ECTSI|nr:ankyrin repeat protein [Ectocarpus siliculosus]|eukprot:CBN73782.1 ankyrin repeat protein [Ectocarpus siliculosus]
MHVYPERRLFQGMGSEIWKLVSHSATPQQWKEWLRVPLEHAAARGNLNLVNSLLEAGADGSAGWKGCRGRTLIDAAALGGSEPVVSALLRAGAQPDVNVVSVSSKRSSLYTATVCGHKDAARRLITAGADVNFEDPTGSILGCLGNGGVTPQIYACGSGHLSVVNTLLTAGADVTIRDVDRHSALDNAVCNGHIDVIGALLRHGADVNACDDVGCTPLHHAAEEDQVGAIDALIQAGANIESSEGGLLTPLFFASANCSLKAVHTLLRHGTSLTAQDTEGTTPLHRACYRQDIGVEATVDLLLQWGADETAVHNDGNTPADWLVENNNENGTTCSTAEIGRVRLLLARAPANRAWRRRCWLVMLRSCAKTARATTDKTGDADEGSNDVGDRKDGKCKGARRENGESAGGGVRSRMNGAGEVGVEGGASGLASIVASVVGLGPEEVFRSILSFL